MANYVQSNQTNYTPGSSLSCAFLSNNTAGNTLICGFQYNVESAVATVADTQGNSWSQVLASVVAGSGVIALFIATNCKAGANTVTITLASSQTPAMIIAEYANMNTVDQAQISISSGTSITTPSVTTLFANETIIELGGGPGASWSANSPYTQRQNLNYSGLGVFGAYGDQDVSSTGTYAAAATQGSAFGTDFTMLLVSLYNSGGPPPASGKTPVIFFIQ